MNARLSPQNRRLIDLLDAAVGAREVADVTQRIAEGMQGLSRQHQIQLPEALMRIDNAHYARRLLHRCPTTGYTVVVMTWGPGQETELHDHAGMWCVECVIEGELEVVQYDLAEQREARYRFVRRTTAHAAVGDAGCLIPPFEYHVLRNALPDRRSVTLHVYAGEMDHCNLYSPIGEEWWERTVTSLEYDS